MIDTITIIVEHKDLPSDYDVFLNNKLSNDIFTEYGIQGGIPKIQGRYKNLKITLTGKGLKINGSLTKYITGDNLKTIYKQDVIKCFIQLNEEFKVDFFNGKVTRVDFAGNFLTKYPIKEYSDCLFDLKFYDRCEQQNGLSYLNGNRTVVFYDKIKELKKKDKSRIDPLLLERNILRYEYRLKKNQPISTFLKVEKAKLSDVLDNYQLLINHWLDQFKTINKKKEMQTFNIEILNTKGAFDKHLIRLGIEAIGGELELIKIIKYGKKRKYFDKYPNMASNLIAKYKKIILETSNVDSPNLVQELQNKIEMFNMYAHPKLDMGYFTNLQQPSTTTEIG